MSRRRRADTGKMALFPFLDVLVCTMGSLILLLLVATSRIRAAAVDKAKQAAATQTTQRAEPIPVQPPLSIPLAEPEPDIDPTPEWQTRVEQLTDERDALRNQLAPLQDRLTAAQAAVLRTKVKAASTADRLHEIRSQQADASTDRQRLQAEIDALQSDLTDAELRLAKAAERQKTARSKFAFLPFDGRTGTTKRPILIECTQDCIRFVPEDVRLTPAVLNGFTTGFNPLLIASRELVHYWKAYERVHATDADPTKDADSFETDLAALNDKEREPYVLLLIRPSGAVAFHIAKSFLTQLKVPHGYELITDDMEVDSSNPDPEARQICQAAVNQVLAERDKLLLAIARQRDSQRDQLLLDPSARTFVPKETNESATGFNRPKSPAASVSHPAVVRTPASETPDEGVRATSPLGRPGKAPTKTSQVAELPPEEPLPNTRRFSDDESRPFPFKGERTKSTTSQGAASGASASKPSPRPGTRPANDPRAANNTTNPSATGSNLARMKRRYLMPRSGIGLEKAIPIRVSARRVLIGGEFEIPVEAGVKTESLIDRVLLAMDRVQSDWPSAGDGYHWVPTIKYEVVAGGEQVHQRLNSALFDLGLVSHVEFLDADPDAPKPSRETSRSRATTPVGQASSLPGQKRQAASLPDDRGGAR